MRKNTFFFPLAFGFLGGVALRSFFEISFYFFLALSFLGILFLAFWFFTSRKTLTFFILALVFLSFSIGSIRMDIATGSRPADILVNLEGKDALFEGKVVKEPIEKEKHTQLVVEIEKINSPQVFGAEGLRIIVTAESYPEYSFGDTVLFDGKFIKPEPFLDERGNTFDYPKYLARENIYLQMFYPKTRFVERGSSWNIQKTLFVLKKKYLSSIEHYIPDPHAALVGGLTVGSEESLGEDLTEDFRRSGIIHIVVLSGYNVTIVAEAFMRLLSFWPFFTRLLFGGFAIILFALLTGATPTIVRASIMAILVLIARASGRTYDIARALLMAALLMVMHNPKIMMFDASFQLSFLASLGLIYLSPLLEKYFHFVPTKLQLREFATATIATQIFVLPLLLFKMGQLSLVSFPVNLLVLPVVPLTMLLGFLTGITGFINGLIAFPFSAISFVLLEYILRVVDIFSSLPFASLHINYFPAWLMLLVYVIYGTFLFRVYKKKKIN